MMLELETVHPRPLTVPNAYKAWAYWVGRCNGGGMQVAQLASFKGRLEDERITLGLCEVYARAQMELAIGLQYDEQDSRIDVAVMQLIEQVFNASTADEVHAKVKAVGPVYAR